LPPQICHVYPPLLALTGAESFKVLQVPGVIDVPARKSLIRTSKAGLALLAPIVLDDA
ncbi:hypothetical protein K443DRAFT_211057, partial [Laccaria amethystina LaAM-08-1]